MSVNKRARDRESQGTREVQTTREPGNERGIDNETEKVREGER